MPGPKRHKVIRCPECLNAMLVDLDQIEKGSMPQCDGCRKTFKFKEARPSKLTETQIQQLPPGVVRDDSYNWLIALFYIFLLFFAVISVLFFADKNITVTFFIGYLVFGAGLYFLKRFTRQFESSGRYSQMGTSAIFLLVGIIRLLTDFWYATTFSSITGYLLMTIIFGVIVMLAGGPGVSLAPTRGTGGCGGLGGGGVLGSDVSASSDGSGCGTGCGSCGGGGCDGGCGGGCG